MLEKQKLLLEIEILKKNYLYKYIFKLFLML